MSDRNLLFEFGSPSYQSLGRSAGQGLPGRPLAQQHSPEAEQAFRDAMNTPTDANQSMASEDDAQAPVRPNDVFALLAGQRSAAVDAAPPPDLLSSLHALARQLWVSDAPVGQQRLRLQLDEDRLPGTQVTVGEEAGACLAEFECSVESSFVCLAQPAREMARQLADALGRDALWRVRACGALTTRPGHWRSLSEVIDGGLGVEAYAPAPKEGQP